MDLTFRSPRLAALQSELESGNSRAVEFFWDEIGKRGTPLVERLQDDTHHALVTFLWRGDLETRNVVVLSQLDGSFFDVSSRVMTRLLNTDLWYRTYRVRGDLRTTYRFSPNDSLVHLHDEPDWEYRTSSWRHDPLNPHRLVLSPLEKDASPESIVSVLELWAAPPQPWTCTRSGVPTGQVAEYQFSSAILGNKRRLWVYTPNYQVTEKNAYGLLILLDDEYSAPIPTPTILDNLCAESLVAPMVAVIVDSIDEETRNRELCCFPPYAEFLAREVVPWVQQRWHVSLDASRVIVGGLSAGGLAAAFAAMRHPDVFGNVLSQSGAFWWRPTNFRVKDNSQEFEWLVRRYALSERMPLRFYLEVGLLEHWHEDPPSLLLTNRHFRDILEAKGYPVHYAEYNGGHDVICWRGTLADGLIALAGKSDSFAGNEPAG